MSEDRLKRVKANYLINLEGTKAQEAGAKGERESERAVGW